MSKVNVNVNVNLNISKMKNNLCLVVVSLLPKIIILLLNRGYYKAMQRYKIFLQGFQI